MIKHIISITLIAFYLLGINCGYTDNASLYQHLMFQFSHANVFHLLCNILALYTIKGNLCYIPAFIIGFTASFFPHTAVTDMPTCGASGFIFALIGIQWGRYFLYVFLTPLVMLDMERITRNIRMFLIFVTIPLIATAFIYNVNFHLHLYSLVLGLVYPTVLYHVKRF